MDVSHVLLDQCRYLLPECGNADLELVEPIANAFKQLDEKARTLDRVQI